ncbi:hypothetical protein [Nocardioides daeguensis]|uniref:Uncharacterized protein n=1 Tax=Nocardioides daeguensis TaxID=908359 RepID=A0ABP6USP0_9ACTN|nr:hypothetical protein [Nocardioides daeguensis]MBV6729236.1 hypothetical protein [Nocardioides daeguensis]MCR1774803.1 hypothetical protein [Nocardioides daeguensis]
MTHERATERLRVDVPTLEPDPAFLGMLTHLSATSQATLPRSTRSAGFRVALATGSVAVVATATWAAGVPTNGGVPHTPADSPTRIGPSGTPSPGDVGTPHSDVTTTPGSPLSPGLPGNSTSPSSEHASDPDRAVGGKGRGQGKGHAKGKGKANGKGKASPGKAKGHQKDKAQGKATGHDRQPREDAPPADPLGDLLDGILKNPAGGAENGNRYDDQQRPAH